MALEGSARSAAAVLACLGLFSYVMADAFQVVPGPFLVQAAVDSAPLPQVDFNLTINASGILKSAPDPGIELDSNKKTVTYDAAQLETITANIAAKIGAEFVAAHPPSPEKNLEVPYGNGPVKVSVTFRDKNSEQVIYDYHGDEKVPPASSTKVLTAAAALIEFGALHKFDTKIVALNLDGTDSVNGKNESGRANTVTNSSTKVTDIVLVGGGDILLAGESGDPQAVNGRAGLQDIALQAKEKIQLPAGATVRIWLDDSAAPQASYNPRTAKENQVYLASASAVAINGGRNAGGGYQSDPPAIVVKTLQKHLQSFGWNVQLESQWRARAPQISVVGKTVINAVQNRKGKTVGQVSSAPLLDLLGYMLISSDNTMAENLCHRLAAKQPNFSTPAGLKDGKISASADDLDWQIGTKRVKDLLLQAGFAAQSLHLEDCSGISEKNQETSQIISQVIARAASPQAGVLRAIIPQLPVGGFDGTLRSRIAELPGEIHAKTGTIKSAISLTGLVPSANGKELAFSVVISNLPYNAIDESRELIDEFVTEVAKAKL